jgi:hypothetical protein
MQNSARLVLGEGLAPDRTRVLQLPCSEPWLGIAGVLALACWCPGFAPAWPHSRLWDAGVGPCPTGVPADAPMPFRSG